MRRALAVALFGFPAIASGQSAPIPLDSLRRDVEVRVWSVEPLLKGRKMRYVGRTDSSVVFGEKSDPLGIDGRRTEIPMPSIDRVEMNSGRRNERRMAAGFLKGTLIGAAGGAVTGWAMGSSCRVRYNCEEEVAAIALGVVGGLTGGIVGAAVGARRTIIWTRVRIP